MGIEHLTPLGAFEIPASINKENPLILWITKDARDVRQGRTSSGFSVRGEVSYSKFQKVNKIVEFCTNLKKLLDNPKLCSIVWDPS